MKITVTVNFRRSPSCILLYQTVSVLSEQSVRCEKKAVYCSRPENIPQIDCGESHTRALEIIVEDFFGLFWTAYVYCCQTGIVCRVCHGW